MCVYDIYHTFSFLSGDEQLTLQLASTEGVNPLCKLHIFKHQKKKKKKGTDRTWDRSWRERRLFQMGCQDCQFSADPLEGELPGYRPGQASWREILERMQVGWDMYGSLSLKIDRLF